MKNKRNVKTKLLERTPLEKLFHNLRTFFMLTNRSVLLPSSFYQFLHYVRLLEFSMCLLLTDIRDVWDDNIPLKNIFHFAQIFWRFSADAVSKTGMMVSFIVILALFFVLEITVLGIFITFIQKSVITDTACFVVCLFQEIILQLLFSWVSSQTATLVSLIATDSSFRGTFEIVQLVIYFILLAYFFFYSFNFANNDVAYMKGRSVTWSYKTQRSYMFSTLITLFLTRLIELLPKISSLIFSAVTLVFMVGYTSYFIMLMPFIDLNFNTYYIACSISFTVALILQLVSLYAVHIEAILVLIITVILVIAMTVIIGRINENRKKRGIELLRSVSNNEASFEETYSNKNQFLMSVRFGFASGNFYVFTWQPFLSAIELWPNEKDIWIQWIRFAIIYPDQGRRLEQVMNSFPTKDLSSKYINSQVKFIQNSRNKHLTRDLKQDLNVIDEEVYNIKTIVIAYWNEVSGGSLNSNSTYNISSKLRELINKANTRYLRLISLYPNNYPIANKYSEFMANIVSDPVEGQFWDNKAKVLKNKGQQVLTDATQTYAFEMFPFIPRSLQAFSETQNSSNDSQKRKGRHSHSRAENSLLISGNDDGYDQNNQPNNFTSKLVDDQQNDIKEVNTSESETSGFGDNADDIGMAPSHFRKLGLNAKVPFVTNLVIISIVFFIIGFICIPFLPPIMIVGTLQPYRDRFEVLKSVCDIRTSIMKEAYYMFYMSLRQMPFAGPIVGGAFDPYQNKTLNNELKKLNECILDLQKSYGTVIKTDSKSGIYMNSTTINYTYYGSKTTLNFMEALHTVIGAIMHHDDPYGYYYEEKWYQFIFNNFEYIENSLGNLAQIMSDDMNSQRDSSISLISIILYIFIGAEVILIPIFIIFVLQIRKNWNYILNTINSIPRVAIQKVIQKYSNENNKSKSSNEHKNFKSEFRYQLSLVQMVSSRDTSGGLPIKGIIIIFLVDFIISVVCVVAMIQIMNVTKTDLTHVPMQYYTGTNGIYGIYKLISVFLIKGYIDVQNFISYIPGFLLNPSSQPTFFYSFGFFNHAILKRSIGFIAKMMSSTLDEVTFGTTDYPEKGILYSSSEILELLTRQNGNPYGDDFVYMTDLRLRNFPFFIGLELIYESSLELIEKISNDNPKDESTPFNLTDMGYGIINIPRWPNYSMILNQEDLTIIFQSAALGTYSLDSEFLDKYIEKTNEIFNDKMDEINLILFLIGAALFVVGLFAIAWLNVMIMHVKKVVQFSLSLLSMVDPSYVQEMQNVMNLFYGKTSGTVQTNQTLLRTFNEVESLVPECPLELNNQMHIMSINDKLKEMWELGSESIKGTHLSLILTFNDESVFDKLSQQANGQSHPKEPRHYDTTITLNASKKVINVSFTSYFVPRNKDTKLVLMFKNTNNSESKDMSIDEMKKENNDIKINFVPEGLRSKLDLESDRSSFTSHYIVFSAVEILNIDEFASGHSPKETKTFFKQFENKIKEMCNNQNIDATLLKSIGNSFIVGFNFIQQNNNYYKASQESYDFVKALVIFANSNGYQIRAALNSTKSAVSSLISKNTLKFDVYSDEIQSMILMLKSAKKDQLLFPAKMRDFIPPNVSSEAEEAEILRYNKDSDWGYKLNITSA